MRKWVKKEKRERQVYCVVQAKSKAFFVTIIFALLPSTAFQVFFKYRNNVIIGGGKVVAQIIAQL